MGIVFRWLHGIWALLGLGISVLLVFAGGGHPPPIIFLPVVGAVWVVGHAALWGAGWLARKGAEAGGGGLVSTKRFSALLLTAIAACGLATLIGLVQLVVTLLLREPYPYRGLLWPLTMTVWVLHAACLAGLLLRRRWGASFAGLLAFAWAALLALQIVDHLWNRRGVDPLELVIALGIIAALAAFGVGLRRSRPFVGDATSPVDAPRR